MKTVMRSLIRLLCLLTPMEYLIKKIKKILLISVSQMFAVRRRKARMPKRCRYISNRASPLLKLKTKTQAGLNKKKTRRIKA